MIYIIDNGMHYSDHELHFVETAILPEMMARLVALQDGDEAKIIGTAERIDWREGSTGHIGRYVTICGAHFSHEDQWPPKPPALRKNWVLASALPCAPSFGDAWPVDLLAAIVAEIDRVDGWRSQFGCVDELYKPAWPAMARAAMAAEIERLRDAEPPTPADP